MREIKFRAWNKIVKIMSESFNLECLKNGYFMDKENTLKTVAFYLSDCELMQYTGFKDKNGKEIYEGDILEINDPNAEIKKLPAIVEWKENGFWVNCSSNNHSFPLTETKNYRWTQRIIGNIYENPELQYSLEES